MQIYSLSDTGEILLDTLRDADYLDASTPSIPHDSVIADTELQPQTGKAYIITGARSADGRYYASAADAVDDYRGKTYYDTATGAATEITALGKIPENLTALKPESDLCQWDGAKWAVCPQLAAANRAETLSRLTAAIDAKAAGIYATWTRFEAEYNARRAAAEAYKAAGYTGEASRYITGFAGPAGLDLVAATDLILTQASGLAKLQDELAAQRMRKYELKKDGLNVEQMQAIYYDIVAQMDNLVEAYNNG
ncbi:hypothetical protein IFE17_02610 [Actinobacillus sp. GY-402]|nr:hypothetical protein IFE17_02610 [Actinobacillus sp. GY-402]